MKLSLTWRFGLFLSLVVLTAGIGAALLVLYFDLNYHRRLLIEQTEVLAALGAELARYPLYVGDVSEGRRLLQALAKVSDLEGAAILDASCSPWVAHGVLPVDCPKKAQFPTSAWELLLANPSHLEQWKPVEIPSGAEAALFDTAGQTIGQVWLRFSLASFQNRIQHQIAGVLGALVLLLAVVVGVAIWQTRTRLLTPLLELHRGFRHLMSGQAQALALPKAAPEVQSLYQSFNQVLSWLQEYRQRLETLAFCDSLTGLGNRALLAKQLCQLISLSQRRGFSLALLFLDLDRFKFINDALGHSAGDLLLVKVSTGLRCQLRGEDVLVRMGGDEFVVLLPALSAEPQQARLQALATAEKILSFLAHPLFLNDHQVTVTCSIGIALFPHDAQDAETLLRHADSALYQAKAAGRNTCRFFHHELAAFAHRHLTLEAALRQAVARGELQTYLQPQVLYSDGCIIGAEALLRWKFEGHFVSPAEFVPLLEETGLIFEVTEKLIAELMAHKYRWWQAGWLARLQYLAVNLSPVQLWRRDLAERLVPLLCRDDRCPTRLELELTESSLIQPTPQVLEVLELLREAGIRLAIDDFGTGYSNLAHLKHLPLDAIKIDKSFVHDLGHSSGIALVKAICAIGESLSIKVIAEGVETKEQAERLSWAGCQIMQGYYFYRPMPLEEFGELLKKQAERCSG